MEVEHIVPCICEILFDNNTLPTRIKDQWLKKGFTKKYICIYEYIYLCICDEANYCYIYLNNKNLNTILVAEMDI